LRRQGLGGCRDTAIVHRFLDMGIRLDELANLAPAGPPEASGRPEALARRRRPKPSDDGIAQVVRKGGAQAGTDAAPAMFRHSFADEWRMAGGDDDSLVRLVGWRSRQMLHRYGASAADARAREAHQCLMPG
jgi:integrase